MDVTDVIGDWGTFQRDVLLLVSLRSLPLTCIYYLVHMASPNVDHWCKPPHQLSHLNTTEWKQCCLPRTNNGFSQCQRYELANNGSILNGSLFECSDWEYAEDKQSTLTSEFDLVCDKRWLLSVMYAAFYAGNLVCYPLAGYTTDRIGRKTANLLGVVGLLGHQVALYYSDSIYWFLVVRFLSGLPYTLFQCSTLTLFLEVCGRKHRALAPLITGVCSALGQYALLGTDIIVDSWRGLTLGTSVPLLLPYLFLCLWFMPESPRWLVATGKTDRARQVLQLAAKKNGIHVHDMDSVMKALEFKARTGDHNETDSGMKNFIVEKRLLSTTILLMSSNMTNTFTGNGFYVALRSLGGNFRVNFAITASLTILISIVDIAILSSFPKRRITLVLTFGVSGILFLVSAALSSDLQWLRITLALLARMSSALTAQTLYLLTHEFFPTRLRARGYTLCLTAGRFGAFLSSFADLLRQTQGPNSPYFLFGGLGLAMSACFLLAPDIDNRTMPDTLAESKRNMDSRNAHEVNRKTPEARYNVLTTKSNDTSTL